MKLYICDSCGHWRTTHGFMEFLCRLTNAAYRTCCPQCQTAMRQFDRSTTIPPFLHVGSEQDQGFEEEEEEETPEQVEHETEYVTLADIFPEYKAYNEWKQQRRRVLHFGQCRGRDA